MGSESKAKLTFGDAIKPFRNAGIPARVLLPVAPVDAKVADTTRGAEFAKNLGKAPGRYYARKDQWGGLGKDADDFLYVANGVALKADQKEFASWPTPNVGILGRFAPAIDSDAENDDARQLVEETMMEVFGREAEFAERLRGDAPRRLYAFKAASLRDEDRVVRSRHVHYRLRGECEGYPLHKIDVIGAGNQYLIAGQHKSGDKYRWHPDYDLRDLFASGQIEQIENADIVRFLETFECMLEERGGSIVHTSGGQAPGAERDYSDQDPIMPAKDIFDGLQEIPNNEANFPSRDDFVYALSAIRAALGAEAEDNRDQVEAWATAEGFADREYFEKVWDSLQRSVRVSRHSLDTLFKRHKVYMSARSEFTGDVAMLTAPIKADKQARREAQDELLREVFKRFVIGRVNTATDDNLLRMRRRKRASTEWRALDWWQFRSDDPEVSLIQDLHNSGRYAPSEAGLWKLVRDMLVLFPHGFYTGYTRHPGYERGQIVEDHKPDGEVIRKLNLRYLSPVILEAGKQPKNPKQAREDLTFLLDFIRRVFGEHAEYELDTLAYMAQTTKRPGHMLFLVGEKGMGKSIYSNMLVSMFDGIGEDMGGSIDGTKLMSEASRRFAMAKVEGCRIISVKELPDGTTPANMAAVTSVLKQMVDPGPDGDYFQVEAKFKDGASIHNFARIISTSNYANAILVEQGDRRIFYVACSITSENRPDSRYYADLTAITKSPARLATLWRYLLERDISRYEVAKAPPVSVAKQEAEIAGITDPLNRHFVGAIEVFRCAKRSLFDAKELANVMAAMADNEYANTNGVVDDRTGYDFRGGLTGARVGKLLSQFTVKVASLKSNGARLPTIYGFKTARKLTDRLASASRNQVLDALERDIEDHRLSSRHPWSVFQGPPRSLKSQR